MVILGRLFVCILIGSVMGCASIIGSKHQPISVQTYHNGQPVEDVSCVLNNDKGVWFVKTPGSTTVRKSGGDLTVTCKKDNLPTGLTYATSSANGGAWGNILFGGLIGYAVDASSGAAFDYPTVLNVQMGQVVDLKPAYPAPQPEDGRGN